MVVPRFGRVCTLYTVYSFKEADFNDAFPITTLVTAVYHVSMLVTSPRLYNIIHTIGLSIWFSYL